MFSENSESDGSEMLQRWASSISIRAPLLTAFNLCCSVAVFLSEVWRIFCWFHRHLCSESRFWSFLMEMVLFPKVSNPMPPCYSSSALLNKTKSSFLISELLHTWQQQKKRTVKRWRKGKAAKRIKSFIFPQEDLYRIRNMKKGEKGKCCMKISICCINVKV